MSARRTLVRNTVFIQSCPQVFHLADTGFQIIEFRPFIQALRQSVHIPPRHASVSNKSFIHNTEHLAFFPQFLVFECHESAHVDNCILLRRHGHNIGIGEHLFHNLLDALILIPFLPGLDKISIFCKTG